jgi:hypothetical protein
VVHRGGPASPTVALGLWLPDGEVQVRFWDRDSVDIEVGLDPDARLAGGVSGADGTYAIEPVTASGTTVPRAKVVLTVPTRAILRIKSAQASTVVTGGSGQLHVLTVTGRTIVRDAVGTVRVESIGGDVELWRVAGRVWVRGGAGDVALNDVSGRVTVTTVSGDIAVNRADVTRYIIPEGSFETLGGAVRVRGAQAPGGRFGVQTHDGAVDLLFFDGALPQFYVDRDRQPTVDAQISRLGGSVDDRGVSVYTLKGTLKIGTIPALRQDAPTLR